MDTHEKVIYPNTYPPKYLSEYSFLKIGIDNWKMSSEH